PLTKEVGDLAVLIEELAQSVAEHDNQLDQRAMFAPAETSTAGPAAAAGGQAREPAAKQPAPNNPLASLTEASISALINDALNSQRIDVHLQPIVTLPQRKVRYYEAFSRLRLPEGKLIEAAHFMAAARANGIITRIDMHLVEASIQLVRRFAAK